MAGRRRRPRSRVVSVDQDRFAAGWRLLPDIDFEPIEIEPDPDLLFDVIRPSDLVALTILAYDAELVTGDPPFIRPKEGREGRLVVQISFQHVAERAIYEAPAPVPLEGDPTQPPASEDPPQGEPQRHMPPIETRPARASRLVFEIPAREKIVFTSEGVLDALKRLPMLVHSLAKPREGRIQIPTDTPIFHLPEGLVAAPTPAGLVISRARRGLDVPDVETASGLSALAREGRLIRSILATRAGTSVSGIDLGEAG
ncbi:MAG: hypothetical protein M3280_09425, partial [Actinomycetota bacterium]|nr:hypothetical protein [Actinomycetota bacterium]